MNWKIRSTDPARDRTEAMTTNTRRGSKQFIEQGREWSYCGHGWPLVEDLPARRRCYKCLLALIIDGKLRVLGV